MNESEIKIGDNVIAPPLIIKGTVTHITDKGVEFETEEGWSWTYDASELELVKDKVAKRGSKKTGGPESTKPTQHATPERD